MPRLTLAAMSGTQPAEHYHRHVMNVVQRARKDLAHAHRGGSRRLIAAAEARLEKVLAIHAPRCRWQLTAAKERQEKYGTLVAAGFLAAYGWSVEAAMWTLLRK